MGWRTWQSPAHCGTPPEGLLPKAENLLKSYKEE